jgi:hypothetical protein
LDSDGNEDQNHYEFDTAHAVAIFLWGKDIRYYKIFAQVTRLPADITGIEQRLKRL